MTWKPQPVLNESQLIEKLQERLAMKWPHCAAHGNASHLFERELPVGSVVRFTYRGDYTKRGAVHLAPGVWASMHGDPTGWSESVQYSTEGLRHLMATHQFDWAHIQ